MRDFTKPLGVDDDELTLPEDMMLVSQLLQLGARVVLLKALMPHAKKVISQVEKANCGARRHCQRQSKTSGRNFMAFADGVLYGTIAFKLFGEMYPENRTLQKTSDFTVHHLLGLTEAYNVLYGKEFEMDINRMYALMTGLISKEVYAVRCNKCGCSYIEEASWGRLHCGWCARDIERLSVKRRNQKRLGQKQGVGKVYEVLPFLNQTPTSSAIPGSHITL